jgi:hypothetical protein
MLVGIEDRLDDIAADLEGVRQTLELVRERLQLVGIRAAATESSLASVAFLDKSTATASEVSASSVACEDRFDATDFECASNASEVQLLCCCCWPHSNHRLSPYFSRIPDTLTFPSTLLSYVPFGRLPAKAGPDHLLGP